MNRIVLLLNGVILVVTFVVALSATDSQIGLLRSAAAAGGVARSRATRQNTSVAFLHVVQSLKNFMPPKAIASLTPEQLDTIHEAVRGYYRAIRAALVNANGAKATGRELLAVYEDVGRRARGEVEEVVMQAFLDRAVVSRLATEIIRHCR